ncbi:MAG: hypothetical protein A2X86_07615 [Bdellovibrionales bacterium GWA2_49_15]|nr:MAG: hypothetical protein A2X86_07615 [Bdellovibrionales bacterium GWA2_49_15]HAZ11854.1 hypothetical protein [Bdellovibrionales bacterium]
MTSIKAPLLPLPNVVFFPKTALPLYVDTPSYGRMIRDCAMKGLPVVICMAYVIDLPPDQRGLARQQLRPAMIGSLGIPYILEEYPGGAMKVLVKGLTRARLLSPSQNLPYPVYNVEVLTGPNSDVGNLDGQLTHINNILEAWVTMNVPNSEEREAFFTGLESTEHIANYVSMLLIRDFEIRQTLLETDSLLDRIHLLGALLRDGIPLKEDREVVGAIKEFETLERLTRAAN